MARHMSSANMAAIADNRRKWGGPCVFLATR
jgi:hypothetical protein